MKARLTPTSRKYMPAKVATTWGTTQQNNSVFLCLLYIILKVFLLCSIETKAKLEKGEEVGKWKRRRTHSELSKIAKQNVKLRLLSWCTFLFLCEILSHSNRYVRCISSLRFCSYGVCNFHTAGTAAGTHSDYLYLS